MKIDAPARWQCIDFISDLHLQAADLPTFQAWSTYLEQTEADAVFILGDLFEVWVGDDILSGPSGFEARCADVLRKVADRLDIHIMCGNRDFLMGASLMQATGCIGIEDPCTLGFAGDRWILTHGDAHCLADTEYLQFRTLVRSETWQQDFLQKPLSERMAIARALRAQSEARKREHTAYADVDTDTATALLHNAGARHLIHGHTHRPAKHPLGTTGERLVLSDWDFCAVPPRGEVLRLRQANQGSIETFTVERIPPSMAGR